MISFQLTLFLVGLAFHCLSLTEAMNYYQSYYQPRIQSSNGCGSYTCGTNAKCTMTDGRPVCSCLNLYIGDPLSHCHRVECQIDDDCANHKSCLNNNCVDPCAGACGVGANCRVVNHVPTCSCPPNWLGSPFTRCYAECTVDGDCPGGKPVCSYHKCSNPCENACGINANCELRGATAICSCPRDMTGDPFVSCRPFTPEDLCKPNPCGENAVCNPGHDNTGKERPVCTCEPGYIGNALTSCRKGECQSDNECADNRACIDYYCQDPCTGKECALTAKCEARRHIAVCTCPDGSRGDAVVGCSAISSRYGAGKYLRG